MSEADKIFEELGYKKVENRHNIDFNKIYNFTNGDKIKEQIRFCKLDKYVHLECYNYNTGTTFGKFLDMRELQAICLKCKELSWNRKYIEDKKIFDLPINEFEKEVDNWLESKSEEEILKGLEKYKE